MYTNLSISVSLPCDHFNCNSLSNMNEHLIPFAKVRQYSFLFDAYVTHVIAVVYYSVCHETDSSIARSNINQLLSCKSIRVLDDLHHRIAQRVCTITGVQSNRTVNQASPSPSWTFFSTLIDLSDANDTRVKGCRGGSMLGHGVATKGRMPNLACGWTWATYTRPLFRLKRVREIYLDS